MPFGLNTSNNTAVVKLMMNSNPVMRIVTAGILAPIVEEFIFRKFLIDRTYRYGEWVAILTSGLMFGLFHGNLAQFFFTTLIGGLFAYIYIRTGKIWYTIALHMTMNLATSVVTMFLLQDYLSIDPEIMNEYSSLSTQYLSSGGDPALQQRITEIGMQVMPNMLPFSIWMGFLGQLVLVGIVLWIIFLAKKKFTIKRTEEQVEHGMRFAWGNIGMILFIVFVLFEAGLTFYSLVATK
jgi:membrane protease YdiL (CAAX protease family)